MKSIADWKTNTISGSSCFFSAGELFKKEEKKLYELIK